ncbi:hypothetical protein SAMN03159495_1688 [Pseudomonas sp. NFR16]|nr:hypothetical protein SAMN03159495_1688 [Pseudomonas sp. NFR16]
MPGDPCGSELAHDEADMLAEEISRGSRPSSFVLDTNLATPQIPRRSALARDLARSGSGIR